jgi:hypothetical protein
MWLKWHYNSVLSFQLLVRERKLLNQLS